MLNDDKICPVEINQNERIFCPDCYIINNLSLIIELGNFELLKDI
jgi:hypothetical protein